MDGFVNLLFLALWAVIGFFVLRYLGLRYFHESRRADVAALAVALAFAIGAIWPYSSRLGGTAATAPQQPAAAPAAQAAAPPATGHDTSAACATLRGPSEDKLYGAIDDIRPVVRTARATMVPDNGRLDHAQRYYVEGWAADATAEHPASGVCLLVDGKVAAKTISMYGFARPDVASGYHRDAMTLSGYRIEIPARMFSAGTHHLRVVVVLNGGITGTVRLRLADRMVVVF